MDRMTFPSKIWNAETNAFDPRLLVVKVIDKPGQDNLDQQRSAVWILINVSWDKWLNFYNEDVKRSGFKLHPVLLNTKNPLLREYLDKIPAGAPRDTAFSNHRKGSGKISVPPQTMLVYSIAD
jgi:hypothetical protein